MFKNRDRGRWRLALLAIAVSLVAARGAFAQGTQGTLADPMSTGQLMEYADRLELSPQQRAALESIHDDYKREFRALRDGDIAELMRDMGAMQGRMPQRKEVESLFERMSDLRSRIRRLDDRLFDRLAPMLTEEQLALLPRVRIARQRATFEAQQMLWLAGRPPADVGAAFRSITLDPETFAAIDPAVAGYERRMTAEMAKLAKANDRMLVDVFEALEAAGFGDMDQETMMSDPQRAQEMMRTMQAIWKDLSAKSNKLAAELRDINETTYRSIAAMLPPEQRRPFRDRYYRDEYPQLYALLAPVVGAQLDALVASDELDEETRGAIALLVDEYRLSFDRIIEEGAKAVREYRDAFSPFDAALGDDEETDAYQQKLGALREEVTALDARITTALNEVLGPARVRRLVETRVAEGEGEDAPADDEDTADLTTMIGGQLVPGRIASSDLDDYADVLGLDDEQRRVLEELHRDYVEAFRQLPELAQLRALRQELFEYDSESSQRRPRGEDELGAAHRAREAAVAAIVDLDDAFFEDVRLTLAAGEEQAAAVDRARRWRARQRLFVTTRDVLLGAGFDRSSESEVDLVEIAREQPLPAADRVRMDGLLAEYEQESLPLLRSRYEAIVALQQATEGMIVYQMRAREEGAPVMEIARQFQERLGRYAQALGDANERVAAAGRRALERMAADLPDAEAVALRRAYNVRAFPNVYDDPLAVDEHLTRAQGLDDLTGEQQQALLEVAAGYRGEYERLSREMVAVTGSDRPLVDFQSIDWQDMQRRQAEMERLRFDRTELNLRTLSQLRGTLTDAQIARIGGLPEPPSDEDD